MGANAQKGGDKHVKEDDFILLDRGGVSSFIGKFFPWKVTIQNKSLSNGCHAEVMFTGSNQVSSASHLVHFVAVLAQTEGKTDSLFRLSPL